MVIRFKKQIINPIYDTKINNVRNLNFKDDHTLQETNYRATIPYLTMMESPLFSNIRKILW